MKFDPANDPSVFTPPFTYTFEEYEEAQLVVAVRQHRLAAQPQQRGPNEPVPKVSRIIGFLRAAALLAPIVTLAILNEFPQLLGPRREEFLWIKIIGPMILCLLVMGIIASFRHQAKFGERRLAKPQPNAPSRTNQILTLIFCPLIIGVALWSTISRDSWPFLLHDLAVIALPWIFIALLIVVFSLESWRKAGGVIRKAWDDSPHLHCEKRIGIDTQAFRLIDSQARYELNWEILAGEEGDTIFVLLTGGVFYIVPKRVLSPAQSEYIIDRLGLRPTEARSGGFPVLPSNPNTAC